jgi:hypothetical protein
MRRLLTKKLVVPIAVLFVLGGAAGAVAATQGSGNSGARAYIDDLAGRLHVTPSALTAAMTAALDDQIDAAVTAGRLTPAQGAALKQRVANGGGRRFRGAGFGKGVRLRGLLRAGARAAAGYLGISVAQLRADLAAGKTLSQIASSTPGRSTEGLRAALLAAARTKLDRAVAKGRISGTQEQAILSALSTHIDTLLQRTWHANGSGRVGPFRRARLRGRGIMSALPLFGP